MAYKAHTKCRFCDAHLEQVIHLGESYPLAGGFLRDPALFEAEKTYPLSLGLCEPCATLQCCQVVDKDILFRSGYFYYSSMLPMLVNHFEQYAAQLKSKVKIPENAKIIEIGCNDGVFLRPLRKQGFKVIGVDPSQTSLKCKEDGFAIYNEYFDETLSEKILASHGKFDFFLSSNSFAHIDNMKSIINGMKILLKPEGEAIIEVHYAKSIIDELQFDFIYHEHMSYYTVSSFERIAKLNGMSLIDVEFTNIHGKSIRVYLKNSKDQPMPDHVKRIIDSELEYTKTSTFVNFEKALYAWKEAVMKTLETFKGKKIYGYGSSGRANILCRFLDIDLDEIIDDAPSKIGSYTPIYHKQIKSSAILSSNPPDAVFILAWPYFKDIYAKIKQVFNGTIIVPLPTIQIF